MDEVVLFKTVIYSGKIKFDDSLTNDILEMSKTCVSQSKSNEGGWQSEAFISSIGNQKLNFVLDQLQEKIKYVYNQYGINREPKLSNYWLNVNKKYDYNATHIHPFSTFSAVFYLQVPNESGQIVFYRDEPIESFMRVDEINQNNNPVYKFNPEKGDVLIFPAYLKHDVKRNNTNDEKQERISLSLNYI